MKEYIAYKDHDREGDVWSERAFLFSDRETVRNFFTPENNLLKEIYCAEGEYDPIIDFEISDDNPAAHITVVEFKTKYSGAVRIIEMCEGYVIPSPIK